MRLSLCEAPTRERRPDHNTGNYERTYKRVFCSHSGRFLTISALGAEKIISLYEKLLSNQHAMIIQEK